MGQGEGKFCCGCQGSPNVQVVEAGDAGEDGNSVASKSPAPFVLACSPRDSPPYSSPVTVAVPISARGMNSTPRPVPPLHMDFSQPQLQSSASADRGAGDSKGGSGSNGSGSNRQAFSNSDTISGNTSQAPDVAKPALAMTPVNGSENDRFQTVDSTAAFCTLDYDEMTKGQRQEARKLVKEFVKTMVRGREFAVVLPNGQVKTCFCSLNRRLDKIRIRASEKDKQAREIAVASVVEILAGSDKSQSANCEGLATPLDELSVTLALESQECITFRLPDVAARDNLVMCLSMFTNQARSNDL